MLNRLSLRASVVDVGIVRYTPSGVKVLEIVLEHASEQVENGLSRQVFCTIKAILMGDLAASLSQVALGDSLEVVGFLAQRNRWSNRLVLHIQAYRLVI